MLLEYLLLRILLLLFIALYIPNGFAVEDDLTRKDDGNGFIIRGEIVFGDTEDGDFEEDMRLTCYPRTLKEVLSTIQCGIYSGTPAEQIVVSFDLDDTLWRPFNPRKEIKVPPELNLPLKDLIDTIYAENLLDKAKTHNFLIEPDAPTTLQEIANLGVKLMATTSRPSTASSIYQTNRTLEQLGINFNQMMVNATKKSPIQFHAIDLPAQDYHPFCVEARDTKPKFTEMGVLFTSGHKKGETVREFLRMQSYQEQNITHFLHTDDLSQWCESIHEVVSPLDIQTTCFQFSHRYDFSTQAEIDRYLDFIRTCERII